MTSSRVRAQDRKEVDMTKKRIIAKFIPQAWVRDYATDIDDGGGDIDVTKRVVALGREKALRIVDDSFGSDELVSGTRVARRHNGPFRVVVEAAIREYFEGVQVGAKAKTP